MFDVSNQSLITNICIIVIEKRKRRKQIEIRFYLRLVCL